MRHIDPTEFANAKPSFGRWILAQLKREDAVGDLSRSAHRDPRFPIDGDFEEIAKRLKQLGADFETLLTLEEAELDWAAI